ncbi:MAG: NUMOD4 domain-containing protein [Crocinitomicaceae bacterium]
MQRWLPIPGFQDYEVSNQGNIKSLTRVKLFKNGRKMKFESKKKQFRRHPSNGFLMTDLINDKGNRKTVYPHKVVASVFLENDKPRKKKVVTHINGDLENNNSENLRWCTFSESIKIGFESGKRDNSKLWEKRRLKYGPNGGNSSLGRPDPLSDDQKKQILNLRKDKSLKQLAEQFNCSPSHIHKTLRRLESQKITKTQ